MAASTNYCVFFVAPCKLNENSATTKPTKNGWAKIEASPQSPGLSFMSLDSFDVPLPSKWLFLRVLFCYGGKTNPR